MSHKINLKLLPIKLHYFLRFSATASLGLFLPVIVRQKGVPPQGIGLLWTGLPFIAFFTNSVSGWIADAFKIHRAIFLTGLMLLTGGMCSVYFLPKMDDNFFSLSASNSSLLSNLSSKSYISRNDTILKDLYLTAQLVDDREIQMKPKIAENEDLSLSQTLLQASFWLVFVCLVIQHTGMGITLIFTDAVCFKILGPNHKQFGRQMMWGTIGMGILSPVIGGLIDWYSSDLPEQDYLPAFIICVVLMFLDILLVSKMTIPAVEKDAFQCDVLKSILKSPQTIIFLIIIIVYGFSCGVNWTFRLLLVEDVTLEYDSKFANMKLLLGLIMAVETFGGELPCLFFSGHIIKYFGHEFVFSVCLMSIFLRYFLYFIIVNPWLFLLVEALNGPSYGLFHANMVSYGTKIAPTGALATIHAIVRSSFSAGQSLGGLIGGVLYNSTGGRGTFFCSSLITFGFAIFYITIQTYYYSCKIHSKGKYVVPGAQNAPDGHTISQQMKKAPSFL